jgi:hypothetical protein
MAAPNCSREAIDNYVDTLRLTRDLFVHISKVIQSLSLCVLTVEGLPITRAPQP